MSGTKASNQQRTTKKIRQHILSMRLPQNRTSIYQQGWNSAIDSIVKALDSGDHLRPEVVIPNTPLPPEGDRIRGQCGVEDAGAACIHVHGHVEAGQPLHSNGVRTWRDRR